MRALILSASAALSLAACGDNTERIVSAGETTTVPTPTATLGDRAMVAATRRLVQANDAHSVAAAAGAAAARSPLLAGRLRPHATRLRELNALAGRWLDYGYKTQNAAERLRAADIIDHITALTRAITGVG